VFSFSKSLLLRLRIIMLFFSLTALGPLLVACGDTDPEADAGARAEAGAPPSLPDFEPLVSFEALYQVTLKDSRPGSAIAGYAGLMVLVSARECEGFRSEQRIVADLSNPDGNLILSEFFASAWEDFPQRNFRFFQTSRSNNRVIQEIAGHAERAGWGEQGRIVLDKPQQREMNLGADVLFPTMYTAVLLDHARRGGTYFAADLYDGSDEHSKYHAVAAIGKRKPGRLAESGGPKDAPADGQGTVSYWPIQLSYYAPGRNDGMPEFQLAMRLFENGIGTDLVMDYGTFALDAELKELNFLDDPDCR